MTTTVIINRHENNKNVVAMTDDHRAAKAVRLKFNPSQLSDVDELKILAAAFWEKAQQISEAAIMA